MDLSPQHEAFLDAWLASGDPYGAAAGAGFARTYAPALVRRPDILAAAKQRIETQALGIAPDLLRTLAQIAGDPGAATPGRVAAARTLLEVAGVSGKAAPAVAIQIAANRADVTTLSAGDLDALADQLAAEADAMCTAPTAPSAWPTVRPAPAAVTDVDWSLVPPAPTV